MSVSRPSIMCGRLAGASALVVVAHAGAAAAQVPGLDERRMEFTVSGSAVYDSNVARGSQAVADMRDIRKGDITYSPNANVNISQPFGRQTVFLLGDIGYQFYQRNSKLQRERIGLTGGVTRPFGFCQAGLNGGFSRAQSDLADLSLDVTKNTQETVSVGANLSCMPLAGLGASVGVQYGETTNSAARGVVNSSQRGVNAGLSYTNSLIGTVSLTGSYSTSDYTDPGLPDSGVPDGNNQSAISLAIARPIGSRLTGTASVAYMRLRSDGAGAGFDGVTGSGALSYRVNPRFTTQLSYRRAVTNTLVVGSDYRLSETLSLSGSYRIGSRVNASLSGQLSRGEQKGLGVAPIGIVSNDRSKSIAASISTSVGRNSNIGINAAYEVRNASPTIFDYDSYRIGISASTTF